MHGLESDIESNSILVCPPLVFNRVAPSPLSISRPLNRSVLAEKIYLPNFSNINDARSVCASAVTFPAEKERKETDPQNTFVSSPAFSLRTGPLSVPEKKHTALTPTVQKSVKLPSPDHTLNFASVILKKFNSFGFASMAALPIAPREPLKRSDMQTPLKTREIRKKRKYTCCNCKNSHCLKMYCECYRSQGACSSHCKCKDCYNTVKLNKTKQDIRQTEKRKDVFIKLRKDQVRLTGPRARTKSSCKCKKSNCLKKYCECFALGKGCSSACECQDCKNISH